MGITHHETLHVSIPQVFLPDSATGPHPEIQYQDLQALRDLKLGAFGVVAAIVNPSGQLLTVRHRQSLKLEQGAIGPLAETSEHYQGNRGRVLETIPETVARAFSEELSIDPQSIAFSAKARGAWTVSDRWPIGKNRPNQTALAIMPVWHITAGVQETILQSFKPTQEVEHIAFMSLQELSQQPNVRPGTKEFIGKIAASSLLHTNPNEMIQFRLPPLRQRPLPQEAVYNGSEDPLL